MTQAELGTIVANQPTSPSVVKQCGAPKIKWASEAPRNVFRCRAIVEQRYGAVGRNVPECGVYIYIYIYMYIYIYIYMYICIYMYRIN